MSDLDKLRCICGQLVSPICFSKNFDVLICERCRTQQFKPRAGIRAPEFRYDSESGKYAEDNYLMGSELRWAHSQLMCRQWSGRKVLEVGCFNGFFLRQLRKRGANVYGFDVNEAALAVGRSSFDLDGCLSSSLDEILKRGPFDDVICIDLLEHLDQPAELLSRIRSSMVTEGHLYVAGPTVERRFFDKSDYPPHHKWRFSRAGLQWCLKDAGFSVERVEIQYDGLLMVRNLIGKILNGLWRKEFFGEVVVAAPSMQGRIVTSIYGWLSDAGQWLFKRLNISYCSTILVAQYRSPQ